MATPEVDEIKTVLYYTSGTANPGATPLESSDNAVGVRLPIKNARRAVVQPSLSTMGFELVHQQNPLNEDQFFDDALVKKVYYPALEKLICDRTGAQQCKAFHHMVRLSDPVARSSAENKNGKAQAPAGAVHVDYTCRSSIAMYDGLRPPGMVQGRFVVLNAWRNISQRDPIVNHHLAMCDASSVVAPDDFKPWTDVKPNGEVNESYRLEAGHASRHRWFYYPNMRNDEVLLFIQYDSNPASKARYAFHSSISDPTATAQPGFHRMSLELRTIAFFPDFQPNTLPENRLSGDAVIRGVAKAIKDSIIHAEHWEQPGKEWMGTDLYKAGGAQRVLKMLVEKQTPARGDPLSEAQKAKVVEVLLADGFEAMAKEAFPRVLRSVEEWGTKLIPSAIQHADAWDEHGRRHATMLVNSEGGGTAGVMRFVKWFVRELSEGKHGLQELRGASKQQQESIVTKLMADSSLVALVQSKFPAPSDPAKMSVDGIVEAIAHVKSWGPGYTWAQGLVQKGDFRQLAKGIVDNSVKEGNFGLKNASSELQAAVIDQLAKPGSAFEAKAKASI